MVKDKKPKPKPLLRKGLYIDPRLLDRVAFIIPPGPAPKGAAAPGLVFWAFDRNSAKAKGADHA